MMAEHMKNAGYPTPIALAVLRHRGQVLVRLRPAGDDLLDGTWEFPGGKIRHHESAESAALRELREETGIEATERVLKQPLRPLAVREHRYPDRFLRLHFFLADLDAPPPPALPPWRWIPLEELAAASIPAANRAVVESLRRSATGETPDP